MAHPAHWGIQTRLKIRQLLLLVELAEQSNVHRAAEMLNMTQPAASKLLKDLEDALGVELFERLPRGIRPTWYGESMARHARMVLANLQQAYEEITAFKAGFFGHVSIGCITAPGITLIPQIVAQVKKEHPNLGISIDIETSPSLMARLAQGKLDIIVARLSAEHDKTVYRYEPLAEETICALVRDQHPLLKVKKLSLRDVALSSWILPPASSVLRHRFDLMFQEEGLNAPTNVVETSSPLFVTKMLAQSDSIAIIASAVGDYYSSHGITALLPLQMRCNMDTFGVITRRGQLPSPAARVVMRALQNSCQTLYNRKFEHEWLVNKNERR